MSNRDGLRCVNLPIMFKLTSCIVILSQLLVFGTLGRIQKAMDKKEYEKAYELIMKGYEKEPQNPGVPYYHTKLLFDISNRYYNLDSARITAEKSKNLYERATQELIDEMNEEGISIDSISHLHEKIRDRSFQIAIENLTIESAYSFQKKFPESVYEEILNYKVDSIKFRIARLANTEYDLQKFIATNPESAFISLADSMLDGLRYIKLSETGNLKGYYAFHDSYPNSRHNEKVEEFILTTSTGTHSISKYIDFIEIAKSSSLRKKAADVLFYLTDEENVGQHPNQDSIQKARLLSEVELYPVMQNGLFGFYNKQGLSKIDHLYAGIFEDYKCELTNDSWVFVRGENGGIILTKDGKKILNEVDNYRHVSKDLALIERDDLWYLFHKSGFKILNTPVEDAETIGNKWIKVKSGNRWGLFTYMGLQVAEIIYDNISKMESFWVFEKNQLIALYTESLILEEIEERGISLEFKFDDIELVDKNTLIGFRDNRECLLDSTLNFLIPWGRYEIYPESSGWYLRSSEGYRLYDYSEEDLMDRHYSYLESNDGWLTLKTENDWMLLPRSGSMLPSREYDSVKLVNEVAAIVITDEKQTLLYSSGGKISLSNECIQTFPTKNGLLSLSDGKNMTILNSQGEKIISGKFQRATFLNDSLIRVQVRDNQGLIHVNGEWVLNPVFDSIDEKNGLMLTLIDGKIGCYDPIKDELMTTEYEARVEKIKDYYLAKKDGAFGVVDHLKNEIISFNYDEIMLWNDTSYLVKNEGQFSIINESEEIIYGPIEGLKHVLSNDMHSIYRFIEGGKYGLFSNQYDKLLAAEFTDIFNIGSDQSPLIFADQHLDKAGFHVVSYVDEMGKLILSKAYTLEEFEDILCDE